MHDEHGLGGGGHKGMRMLKGALIVIGAIYLALLARNAAKEHDYIGRPESQRDTIVIAGEGKVTAVPDIATISIGVTTEKASVTDAQKENTSKMNAVIAKLKEFGIADEDLKTTNYTIYPLYDYPNGRQVQRGFQVSQTVEAKIRDLDKIGEILATAGGLGANQVSGVNFTIDEPEEIRQEARLEALANARQKAEALAEAAGVRLGKIVGFSESVSGYQPPIYFAKQGDMAQEGAAAPSIETGSQEVVVNVSVTYEILP